MASLLYGNVYAWSCCLSYQLNRHRRDTGAPWCWLPSSYSSIYHCSAPPVGNAHLKSTFMASLLEQSTANLKDVQHNLSNTIFIPSRPRIISIKKLKIITEVTKITSQGFRSISVHNSAMVYYILSVVPFYHITIPYNPTYDISHGNHHPSLIILITTIP